MIFSLFNYDDSEIKKIISTLVVLIDSREKENRHIIQYLEDRNIQYSVQKLDVGDYGCMIPMNEQMTIMRDLYLPITIERKAHIDELIGNFLADKRTTFQNELIRSQKTDFVLLVEQVDGYSAILNQGYRSRMLPQSVIGTLKSFESKYKFNTIFIDRETSPHWIQHHLFYKARNILKGH